MATYFSTWACTCARLQSGQRHSTAKAMLLSISWKMRNTAIAAGSGSSSDSSTASVQPKSSSAACTNSCACHSDAAHRP